MSLRILHIAVQNTEQDKDIKVDWKRKMFFKVGIKVDFLRTKKAHIIQMCASELKRYWISLKMESRTGYNSQHH